MRVPMPLRSKRKRVDPWSWLNLAVLDGTSCSQNCWEPSSGLQIWSVCIFHCSLTLGLAGGQSKASGFRERFSLAHLSSSCNVLAGNVLICHVFPSLHLQTWCVVSGHVGNMSLVMLPTLRHCMSARVSKRHDIWRHVSRHVGGQTQKLCGS
jgi:hypothetical protein